MSPADNIFAAYQAPASSGLHAVSRRYLHSSEFPDVAPAYRALGLSFDEAGRVRFSDDANARMLREAMTKPAPGRRE